MRLFRLFVLLAAACAAVHAAGPQPEGLAGTRWKVREKTFKSKIFFWRYDQLSFTESDFRSSAFQAKGFQPASYTAGRTGESYAWTGTLTHPGLGKVVWEGRRSGDAMEGTWTWMAESGKPRAVSWAAKRAFGGR